ncbi:hypothetical protein [Variovorax sp. WS11]|uniref:hypothetical protein n=1 Tax=Variovorax sp. WS11 TaxID=1105204 RepID=UPI0013DA7E51|nr:hypothetical protein [Variovorax sp. WS11]NDZ16496.1 hypothetical protein [Variovorax sp. WS11]
MSHHRPTSTAASRDHGQDGGQRLNQPAVKCLFMDTLPFVIRVLLVGPRELSGRAESP